MAKEQEYYGKAFAASDRELNPAESAEEERYVKIGEKVAQVYYIEEQLRDFVSQYGLARKKALDGRPSARSDALPETARCYTFRPRERNGLPQHRYRRGSHPVICHDGSVRILLTNDDGWDAPGLAALKTLARQLGEVFVLAPRDPHSYAGHRVTTDCPLVLAETGSQEFTLTGTPADCVRLALTTLFPEIDWVLSGINRGGNLGADLFTSGTVAAVREAALLGRPGIAVSQYIRRGVALDWERSAKLALPVIAQLIAEGCPPKGYWNVNLPHVDVHESPAVVRCDPDHEPLDIRFRQDGDRFHYAGDYASRRRTQGRDTEQCFGGSITVSCLRLG